ncbi:MAG: AGE family epimerase/isomerase, partial [Pseudomonadota bacterium]
MTSTTAFLRAAESLRQWLTEEALPLAATAMRDPEGGYFEDLTLTGEPRREQIRRVRVQPRQAYVFAHAHVLGWHKDARALSDHGFDYLLAKAACGDPFSTENFQGFVHRLNADGSISDPMRDTYDHAFVLLACAWRIRAFDCERSRDVASATLACLDRDCGQPDGSFLEGQPAALPRRQNPHMHLFEAFLALGTATNDERLIDRAAKIYGLFKEQFIREETGTLKEFFAPDWSPDPEKGHLIEPGHMMEWCWLLDEYSQITGIDLGDVIDRLYPTAEKYGLDQDSGFLMDYASLDAQSPAPQTRR